MLDSCSDVCFQQIELRRTIYTALDIKLLCLKSDFATLKSSKGLAALLVPRVFTQRFGMKVSHCLY